MANWRKDLADQIRINELYADACESTYAATGRSSALAQAAAHRNAAARKLTMLQEDGRCSECGNIHQQTRPYSFAGHMADAMRNCTGKERRP